MNAYIVLGFALGGLVFDFISLYAYFKFSDEENIKEGEHPHHHHIGDDPLRHVHNSDPGHEKTHNVNMLSALMHIGSDLMRSTTTFVEGIILLNITGIDSVRVDGWCALIVCSLIAFGAIWSVLVWMREVYKFCCGGSNKEEEDDDGGPVYKQLVDNV